MFRVLSIDWDYFFDCTMNDRLDMFPDGADENLANVIQVLCGHFTITLMMSLLT